MLTLYFYGSYLINLVGEKKFYDWYKVAVETGDVDTRTLLGLGPVREQPRQRHPIWVYVVVGVVVLGIIVAALISWKRENDYY